MRVRAHTILKSVCFLLFYPILLVLVSPFPCAIHFLVSTMESLVYLNSNGFLEEWRVGDYNLHFRDRELLVLQNAGLSQWDKGKKFMLESWSRCPCNRYAAKNHHCCDLSSPGPLSIWYTLESHSDWKHPSSDVHFPVLLMHNQTFGHLWTKSEGNFLLLAPQKACCFLQSSDTFVFLYLSNHLLTNPSICLWFGRHNVWFLRLQLQPSWNFMININTRAKSGPLNFSFWLKVGFHFFH